MIVVLARTRRKEMQINSDIEKNKQQTEINSQALAEISQEVSAMNRVFKKTSLLTKRFRHQRTISNN